ECRRMPENAGECRRMPENAGECRRMPENAGECRRMPENAGECRDFLAIINAPEMWGEEKKRRLRRVWAGGATLPHVTHFAQVFLHLRKIHGVSCGCR
ncbi:MAG: hypothetical protein IJM64_01460, partial [Ottowia sp.]|nr:hypothetical protein [Ottowia sp.]